MLSQKPAVILALSVRYTYYAHARIQYKHILIYRLAYVFSVISMLVFIDG
jgi:uncharacterized membrane protein